MNMMLALSDGKRSGNSASSRRRITFVVCIASRVTITKIASLNMLKLFIFCLVSFLKIT